MEDFTICKNCLPTVRKRGKVSTAGTLFFTATLAGYGILFMVFIITRQLINWSALFTGCRFRASRLKNLFQVTRVGSVVSFYVTRLVGIPASFNYQPSAPFHFIEGALYLLHVNLRVVFEPHAIVICSMNHANSFFSKNF